MPKPVQEKEELLKRLRQNQQPLRQYGVKQLGIFGSIVKGTLKADSDIDFYVVFEPRQKTFDNFMELAQFLEELTGRQVELITPRSLNKHIGKYILKEVEYVPLAA